MSLTVLVMIVVVGIVTAVAAVHFTGGSVKAKLAGPDQVGARFAEDFPGEEIATIRITENAETAFLDLAVGRTGIVQSFGDKFLTRIVSSQDVARVERTGNAGVSILFHDFTWGGGDFRFADAEAAEAVFGALGGTRPAIVREAV